MSSQQNTDTKSLGVAEVADIIAEHFPAAQSDLGAFEILAIDSLRATVRLPHEDRFIRPGGTISGPTMFKLADFACYVAILGELGEAAIQSVTTTLTINFLARPQPGDLVGQVRILRLGRRQAVCEAMIYGADGSIVAQASCIYALSPELFVR